MKIIRGAEFDRVAARLVALGAKSRYCEIERATDVPWWVVAAIHEREASQDFLANLAQGDRYDRVSIHEPKGRGPFDSFKAAAIDALVNCKPHAARWADWSPGGALTLLEQYNGLGYANKGLPSPYVWSGTDQYVRGKYVADHVFDPDAVDKQLGCAGLIRSMMRLDPSIAFADARPDSHAPPQSPSAHPASTPSFWAALFLTISSLFGSRKT